MVTNEAILDAGPLIHLSELDALDALQGFSALYIAPTVVEEVKKHRSEALLYPGLTFIVEPLPEVPHGLLAVSQALLLDRGEFESLTLVQNHSDAIFLTDDSAARLVAEQMGVRAHGTIGLLIRMERKGYRKRADVIRLLEQIPSRSTLHISIRLMDDVFQRLKEEWGLS